MYNNGKIMIVKYFALDESNNNAPRYTHHSGSANNKAETMEIAEYSESPEPVLRNALTAVSA